VPSPYHRAILAGLIALAVGAVSPPAHADELPPVPVTQVELKEHPELAKNGKLAIYRGEADDKGVAFYIEGLGINNPVGIMLISGDAAAPMRLSVKNDLSQDWDKHVKAEAGVSKLQFATEGPAMALVQSPTGDRKPYQLAIWVGPEVPLHKLMTAPFVAQADYDKKHPGGPPGGAGASGGGTSSGAVVGAIAAVLVLVIVIVIVARRKKGASR
jgi:hypothetical protein